MQFTLFSGLTAANNPPVATPATGTITTVASANLVDGTDFFMLSDGLIQKRFEFDKNAATSVNAIRIDVSAVLTADQVRDAIIAVMNQSGLNVVATSGGAATVAITNLLPGPRGNINMFEGVADAGFAVTGMSGGALSGVSMQRDAAELEDIEVTSALATLAASCTIRLWDFWWSGGVWVPRGTGTGANKGKLNAGASIDATNGNNVAHEEPLTGALGGATPDLLYAELISPAGTGAAFTCKVHTKGPRRTA